MLMNGHKKGQYFSFDAIIASVIFVIALVSFLNYWYSMKASLDSKDEDINKEAMRISDAILAENNNKVSANYFANLRSMDSAGRSAELNCPYNTSMLVHSVYGGPGDIPVGPPDLSGTANIAKVRRAFILVSAGIEYPAILELYLYN